MLVLYIVLMDAQKVVRASLCVDACEGLTVEVKEIILLRTNGKGGLVKMLIKT